MRGIRWCALAATAVLAVAGCGVDDVALPEASPDGSSPPTTRPPEVSETTATPDPQDAGDGSPSAVPPAPGGGDDEWRSGEVPEQYLEQVIADAARRTGVPAERIEVIRAEAVQWRDSSLGCPEPGMTYLQVIVDGYWVVLAAGGEELDYRMDDRGNYRLCDRPTTRPPYSADR